MRTIALILEAASPLKPGFHLEIENSPYMALVIEDIQQPGPHGQTSISVAHYGQQNGDLMRDPEMIFEIAKMGDVLVLSPYYWGNDYVGVEEYSAIEKAGRWFVIPELRERHVAFSRTWDCNLWAQGFFEAFLKQRAGSESAGWSSIPKSGGQGFSCPLDFAWKIAAARLLSRAAALSS